MSNFSYFKPWSWWSSSNKPKIDIHSTDHDSPDHDSPDISSLEHDSPDISSLEHDSPDISSLDHDSPDISSLEHDSPDISSPDHDPPDISSLDHDSLDHDSTKLSPTEFIAAVSKKIDQQPFLGALDQIENVREILALFVQHRSFLDDRESLRNIVKKKILYFAEHYYVRFPDEYKALFDEDLPAF